MYFKRLGIRVYYVSFNKCTFFFSKHYTVRKPSTWYISENCIRFLMDVFKTIICQIDHFKTDANNEICENTYKMTIEWIFRNNLYHHIPIILKM